VVLRKNFNNVGDRKVVNLARKPEVTTIIFLDIKYFSIAV
jgi:hypothetical protein